MQQQETELTLEEYNDKPFSIADYELLHCGRYEQCLVVVVREKSANRVAGEDS